MNPNPSRQLFALLVVTVLPLTAFCAKSDPILLWPGAAPGEKADIGEEKDLTTEKDGRIAGKRVIRLGNVSHPAITVYHPLKMKDTGCAVLVCPGGGYHILAMDLEGTEICEWFNSIGVTAILLKYRVPSRSGQEKHAASLQDAQRAMGLVRQHALEWRIDPKRIGVLGFSAGGHLSAAASTLSEKRTYEAIDAADKESCRPDFTMLIYPAYLTVKGEDNKIAPELKVTTNTPPAFLVQTQDDGVGVANSFVYAMALQNLKIPAEIHIYPSGGHGYGLRRSAKSVTLWPDRAEEWMREMGLLKRNRP
jgi:acetyl esterase/lipase